MDSGFREGACAEGLWRSPSLVSSHAAPPFAWLLIDSRSPAIAASRQTAGHVDAKPEPRYGEQPWPRFRHDVGTGIGESLSCSFSGTPHRVHRAAGLADAASRPLRANRPNRCRTDWMIGKRRPDAVSRRALPGQKQPIAKGSSRVGCFLGKIIHPADLDANSPNTRHR